MRNRVARWGASRAAVLGAVTVFLLGCAAVPAQAATTAVALESHITLSFTGPVGVIAVVLGLVGLVLGLLRHRRTLMARHADAQRTAVTEPLAPVAGTEAHATQR